MTGAFDIDHLITEARASTGLSDFGPGAFRENAAVLIEDTLGSGISPSGAQTLRRTVLGTLSNRLRIRADRASDPAIAAQEIRRPIIVLGLPRSGTTFLHSLLSQDPQARSPLQWEMSRPSPPPTEGTYRTDPRIELSRQEMAADSETLRFHMQDAELPAECGGFLRYEFVSTGNFAFYRAPNYLERIIADDASPRMRTAYRLHRAMLQHHQAHTDRKAWVLKSPQHTAHVAELVATYPDATLVITHRDPLQTLPSLASLVSHFRSRNYDVVDKHEVGAAVLDLWSRAMNRTQRLREADPTLSSRIVDVAYRELVRSPMQVVERIHQARGDALSDEAVAAMTRWIEENRQDKWQAKHGSHVYSGAEFGLDPREMEERFADYRARWIAAEAIA